MKTKILVLLSILTLVLFSVPARAQTVGAITPEVANNSVLKVIEFLATNQELLNTNRNWIFVPYASHAEGLLDSQGEDASWGGGVAALYPLNNYLRGGFRMQYFAGEWFMPSVNVQIQSSYKIFGSRASWTPFVFTGIATPIGGSSENGEIGALYGAGLSIKFPLGDKWEIGGGYAIESWSNLRVDHVDHFGIVLDFKF